MKAKLTDEWFEAKFIGRIAGKSYRHANEDGSPILIAEAQGLLLWCPCGFHDRIRFPMDGGRPHGNLILFQDRGVPADFGQ